ncbi:MAG: Ig-like domain-containing protein [Clostridia bacterium]|nr:Ig-like domain-containing protein [Clostridia bacterium]
MKKILAVLLSVFMMLSIVPMFAFAADEVAIPVIAVEKISETETQVVIGIVLEENKINSLDIQLIGNDGLTLTAIEPDASIAASTGINTENGMISVASVNGCNAPLVLAEYTFTKDETDGVVADDFTIVLSACYVCPDSSAQGTDVTDSVVPENRIPAEHTHTPGEWVEATPATCSTKGVEECYCTECGELADTRETDTLPHTDTTATHEDPTCTEDGYDKVVCSCGEVVSDTVLPKANHKEADREKKAPTCTEDGYIKVICACGEVIETITLPTPGHDYFTDIRNASCEEDGYMQTICRVCSDVQSKTSLPMTGHKWLDWSVIKQPTVSAEGVERRVCDNCGADEERPVDKLVVAPTELVMRNQEVTMNYKKVLRLFVSVVPEAAAYSTEIIWESSNPEVATVNEEGEVTSHALGTTTITAKTADGKLAVSCEVTVEYSILQWIIVYILFGWIWYV